MIHYDPTYPRHAALRTVAGRSLVPQMILACAGALIGLGLLLSGLESIL